MSLPTRKLFGTDGVRGRANFDPMTPEMALRLGRAVAYHFRAKHKSGRGRIVIGKDTRLSGYLFETALAAGICSMGADVMLCGPLPTPGIAFITSSMRADAGVVISASHNPFEDMPIKVVGLIRMDGTVEPPTAKLTLRGPSVLLGDVSDKTVSLKVEGSLIDGRPPAKYIRSLVVSGLPAGVAAEVQPDTIMLTTKRKRE